MHLLCAYLDSQMPPNPQFPDGKAFSSQYFHKTPSRIGKPLKINSYLVKYWHYCDLLQTYRKQLCVYTKIVPILLTIRYCTIVTGFTWILLTDLLLLTKVVCEDEVLDIPQVN